MASITCPAAGRPAAPGNQVMTSSVTNAAMRPARFTVEAGVAGDAVAAGAFMGLFLCDLKSTRAEPRPS